jgi:hypothetical protein
MKRRIAIGLILATLCMLKVWRELLNPGWDLFRTAPPARMHYLLAMSITLLLAGCFLVAAQVCEKSRPVVQNLGRLLFLLVWFVALSIVRSSFGTLQISTNHLLHSLPMGLVAVSMPITFGLSLIFLRPLSHMAAVCLLIMSPLTLFVFGRGMWNIVSPRRDAPIEQTGDVPQPVHLQRVVWIIFDEMDQHVAFADRPAGLHLPEFDAFRRTALYATTATAPATQTHYSMPALITGRPIRNVTIPDGTDLMIAFENQADIEQFSSSDNIFRQARRMGFRTGIVGNYLPYCRILHSDLDFCATRLIGVEAGSATTLDDALAEQIQSFLTALPVGDRLPLLSIDQKKHKAVYQGVLADAKAAAADARLNLLLIHFPIPHLPGVLGPSYTDNLILADKTLKELHESMDRAELWESSNILISADHGFRSRPGFDNRVPFLVKLSGQTQPLEYTNPFNTILTRDLIFYLLSQTNPAPQAVSDWLRRASS